MNFEHRVAETKWDQLQEKGAQVVCEYEDWLYFSMPVGPDGLIDSWGKVKWNVDGTLEEGS